MPKGELMITAPVVFGRLHVLPIVTEFLKAFPEIDIRMVLTDRVVNLLEDQVDLAVRIGSLPDSSLVATRVGSIRRVICASPAYFAEHGTPKSPDELRTHNCISYEWSASHGDWKFVIDRSTVSIAVHSRLTVNTAEASLDAAIAGLGITRGLSYQIADAVRAGTLAVALQEFQEPPWPVNFVYTGQRFLPLKLRAFLDLAVPRLRSEIG
jgi:DNA-binding transcriptional LysR family regulator